MKTENLFEAALNIHSPWYIKSAEFSEEKGRLDIYIDFKKGATFSHEGESRLKPYDTKQKTWKHLNFFENETYLHARVPRVQIGDKVRLIKTPWEGVYPGFTLLYEAMIVSLAKHMPVHVIGKMTKESDNKIWEILGRYVSEARENEDFSEVKRVGTDETSRKKGHNYISLFVNLEKKKTMFITEGKDHSTVKRFVEDLEAHGGKAENIEQASIDMSPAFIKGIEENLPNAEITFDKFHNVKKINEAVDKVRREEAKTTPILKKSRYVLLKNTENLKEKERQKLGELNISKINLKSLRAMHIRENFQEIYKAETKEEFVSLLKKWFFWATHSKLPPIIDAAKTIKRHWDGVVAWASSRINNGILEGLNSMIQAAKRKARGFRSTKNLMIIAYLVTGDLNFRSVNKFYKSL